jgi:hypothetical protein
VRFVLTIIAFAALTTACDGLVVVISTSPSSLHAGGTVVAGHIDGGAIIIGRPMSGALTTPGGGVNYHVVAPHSGTLVLGVSWDRSLGLLDVLFASNVLPQSGSAPFTARLPVQAGQTYTIEINDATTRTGATLNLPFTVVTGME